MKAQMMSSKNLKNKMVEQFKAKQNEIARLAKTSKVHANELIVENASKKLRVFFKRCHYTVGVNSITKKVL